MDRPEVVIPAKPAITTSVSGAQIGALLDRQEQDLSDAIRAAFDLD